MSFLTICRVCTDKSTELASIFDYYIFSKECLQIFKVISDCASVQIHGLDGFSQKICHKCIHHLNQAYSFKKLCEDSDYKFRNNLIEDEDKVHRDDNKIIDVEDENLDTPDFIEFSEIKIEETEIQFNTPNDELPIAESWNLAQETTATQNVFDGAPEDLQETNEVDDQFKCDICSKKFTGNFALMRHRKKHTNEKPFKCSVCSKAFKWKDTLRSHALVHMGESSFKCEICFSPFRLKRTLEKHMTMHESYKLSKCYICSKMFDTKKSLLEHRKQHADQRPYNCEVCGKSSINVYHLDRHMKLVHAKD